MHPMIDPFIDEVAIRFLADRLPALGRGTPARSTKQSLEGLSVDAVFEGRRIFDRSAARACLAGLWLWNDCLDESHAVSQEIDTPEGSWWHAIMHRREGDFGNAKYWFRRVGDHPVFPAVADAARRLAASETSPDAARAFLATITSWDPFRFVDLCEEITRRSPGRDRVAREIAAEEWRLLFAHCAALAVGTKPASGIVGIIVAGGAGSRLGGVDKASLLFDGQTFLERVIAAIAPSAEQIVVVAAEGQDISPASLAAPVAIRVVRDSAGGQGPLAAVADALRATMASRPSAALVVSCDVPRLSPAIVRLLVEAIASAGEACDWVVPVVDGHPQVLVSAMRPSMLPMIERRLAAGRRDVRGLLDEARVFRIDEQRLRHVDPTLASFRDVDTDEDLRGIRVESI